MIFDDIDFQDSSNINSHLTLSELNNLLREVITLSMPDSYWVTAELASCYERGGHCYMELVEKAPGSNTPIAQARACIWRSTWMRLAPEFMRLTGQPLSAGMKVLLCVRANYHPAYGFSWIVNNIDASYTMGDMARRRQDILSELRRQGVIDMNKSLPISPFAQRIAVISSPSAAGYGDFSRQLSENEYQLKFQTHLFPAIMQGEHVESSIISALDAIAMSCEEYDAVVIIRGGGSTADLSGFDTLALAENVANFPLPIITGIGHDRDQSVLDLIACVSQKTPTAVATFLINNLASTLAKIEDCKERLSRTILNNMRHAMLSLQSIEGRLQSAAQLHIIHNHNALQQLQQTLQHSAVRILQKEQTRIESIDGRLPLLVSNQQAKWHHHIELLEQRLKALDPTTILKRGYSITMRDGQAITDSSTLSTGDEIQIMLHKGNISAVVNSKK